METIEVKSNNEAIHFAIDAIVQVEENGKIKVPSRNNGTLDIEFKVNGVEVPFEKTIKDIYNRFKEDINKEATKKALDIIQQKGFIRLFNTMYECEAKIKHCVHKITGVEIEDTGD